MSRLPDFLSTRIEGVEDEKDVPPKRPPPPTAVIRDDVFDLEAKLQVMSSLRPPRVETESSPGPSAASAQAEGSRSQNELPSFARMTATQSQRRLKSSPTGGVGSSPSGRRALSSAEAASAYPEPGPGEYLRRTAGVDLDKGARMGSKLVGSQAYLGFGYKSMDEKAMGDYNTGQVSSMNTTGMSAFTREKRGVLPEVGAKSVHNVAGIETTVHYKAQSPIQPMRGTARGSCSPASRSLAPLACSPAAASKNSPSRGMSNRKLQQLPDQAPTGAGSVDDKGGGDGGLKTILDRLISEHQADYAKSAKELAKYERRPSLTRAGAAAKEADDP